YVSNNVDDFCLRKMSKNSGDMPNVIRIFISPQRPALVVLIGICVIHMRNKLGVGRYIAAMKSVPEQSPVDVPFNKLFVSVQVIYKLVDNFRRASPFGKFLFQVDKK